MYSVVLMMALTTGTETPAFGKRGCSGCSGWSCSGSCYGGGCSGCSSSCGGRKRLFGGGLFGKKCRGCSGCSSACHGGCRGGCHGGYACHGGCHASACHGAVCHGAACHGGCGAAPAPAPGPKPMPAPAKKPEPVKKPPEEKESSLSAPATIIVSLPAEAKLLVDDAATTSTSSNRTFVSPVLEHGKDYFYTLTAQVNNVTVSKKITVRAGEETRVALELPVASVASK